MTVVELRSILDKIDATRSYSCFKTKQQGMEVWMVTDFIEDKRTFMSKEKAQSVARDLNLKLANVKKAVDIYSKSLSS